MNWLYSFSSIIVEVTYWYCVIDIVTLLSVTYLLMVLLLLLMLTLTIDIQYYSVFIVGIDLVDPWPAGDIPSVIPSIIVKSSGDDDWKVTKLSVLLTVMIFWSVHSPVVVQPSVFSRCYSPTMTIRHFDSMMTSPFVEFVDVGNSHSCCRSPLLLMICLRCCYPSSIPLMLLRWSIIDPLFRWSHSLLLTGLMILRGPRCCHSFDSRLSLQSLILSNCYWYWYCCYCYWWNIQYCYPLTFGRWLILHSIDPLIVDKTTFSTFIASDCPHCSVPYRYCYSIHRLPMLTSVSRLMMVLSDVVVVWRYSHCWRWPPIWWRPRWPWPARLFGDGLFDARWPHPVWCCRKFPYEPATTEQRVSIIKWPIITRSLTWPR